MDEILNKINNLDHKINNIELTLKLITDKLDIINTSCENMDNHISFIEYTYNYLSSLPNFIKLPFHLPSLN
tara:strand:+ start:247 stop:459 length:213 start_codon:yes stop_codon:yes gene_type:complete